MLPRGEVARCRNVIRHRSRHSQFRGWLKVVPLCGVLNLSNSYSTGNPWSKRNRRKGSINQIASLMVVWCCCCCYYWRADSKTSILNAVAQPKRVFDGFPQLLLPRKVIRLNPISNPDWVKLCVELNYAPDKNAKSLLLQNVIVIGFKPQSHYYIHFKSNIHGKRMLPLSPAVDQIFQILFF